jgi:hypothetical protein
MPEDFLRLDEVESGNWFQTSDGPPAVVKTHFDDPEELTPHQLGIEFPTGWSTSEYRAGRDWWIDKYNGHELENYLSTMPFERYAVYRGTYHPSPRKNTMRVVGNFKGLIRIVESDPRLDALVDMRAIEQIETFKVRLYVVRAKNLQPTRNGIPAPYLRLRLGDTVINDKAQSSQKVP